jgi:glycerophosphoryl diester phosphodiesterase
MGYFQIVAHRGVPADAVELGADAVELDVRLTADQVPVVYHNFYLDEITSASGPIFKFTHAQLQGVKVFGKNNPAGQAGVISTLPEILERLGEKIGLEIEIKGPEPESPEIIGAVLNRYKPIWDTLEVTSSQPALLLAIQKICPGLATDLLFPRSESWMKPDVVVYQAVHLARLARARAVHLHPTQLSAAAVTALHRQGFEIHAWDVNDLPSLQLAARLGIPRICTDDFEQARAFRDSLSAKPKAA